MSKLTHIPTHAGTIRSGRLAEVGEHVTCPACRRQLTEAVIHADAYRRDVIGAMVDGLVPPA